MRSKAMGPYELTIAAPCDDADDVEGND